MSVRRMYVKPGTRFNLANNTKNIASSVYVYRLDDDADTLNQQEVDHTLYRMTPRWYTSCFDFTPLTTHTIQ